MVGDDIGFVLYLFDSLGFRQYVDIGPSVRQLEELLRPFDGLERVLLKKVEERHVLGEKAAKHAAYVTDSGRFREVNFAPLACPDGDVIERRRDDR